MEKKVKKQTQTQCPTSYHSISMCCPLILRSVGLVFDVCHNVVVADVPGRGGVCAKDLDAKRSIAQTHNIWTPNMSTNNAEDD